MRDLPLEEQALVQFELVAFLPQALEQCLQAFEMDLWGRIACHNVINIRLHSL